MAPQGRSEWLAAKCDPTIRAAETTLAEIHQALSSLPRLPSRNNQGVCIGYHSEFADSPDTQQEYSLDLGTSHSLDSIVTVPAHIHGIDGNFTGYGFPRRFRVEVSDTVDFNASTIVADFTEADFPNPGRLPVALEAGGVKGRFLKLVVTRLNGNGTLWFYALGEMFVFGDNRNLSLGLPRPSLVASGSFGNAPVWLKRNAVDGQSGLGAALSAEQSPCLGWRSKRAPGEGTPAWICLDLGRAFPLDEVRVHPAQTQNPAMGAGFAFPKEFIVESSLDPDFENPILLFESGKGDFDHPGNNAVCVPIGRTLVRYLRITAGDVPWSVKSCG